MPLIHVSHFVLTSFSGALVTFVTDQVTRRPLQPILSTGSEQQGQNIRVRTVFSDPDQIFGFTCIFSPGMQEYFFLFLNKILCCGCSLESQSLGKSSEHPQHTTIFLLWSIVKNHLSRVVRKPAFCICENKGADQLRGKRKADQYHCFR